MQQAVYPNSLSPKFLFLTVQILTAICSQPTLLGSKNLSMKQSHCLKNSHRQPFYVLLTIQFHPPPNPFNSVCNPSDKHNMSLEYFLTETLPVVVFGCVYTQLIVLICRDEKPLLWMYFLMAFCLFIKLFLWLGRRMTRINEGTFFVFEGV